MNCSQKTGERFREASFSIIELAWIVSRGQEGLEVGTERETYGGSSALGYRWNDVQVLRIDGGVGEWCVGCVIKPVGEGSQTRWAEE